MSDAEGDRTWDGLPIAADHPNGMAVHVRRRTLSGEQEVLLLHRAHHGPDYAGDWAWTSPAGARLPGEPVYPGALRELAEEAGIAGCELWPVDLSGRWALFVTDVPRETAVDLVDPEHDRWEWVPIEVAAARALPAIVGSQYPKAARARAGGIEFTPLESEDLASVVRWQQAPHAARWFAGGPTSVRGAEEQYGARIRGESSTRMWRVDIEGTPAGYVQAYPVGAYPDYAEKTRDPDAIAFDYVIGETNLAGRGWGRAMIWSFIRQILLRDYPHAPRFLASPDHRNQGSLRVLEACGFVQGLWIDVPPRRGQPAATEIVCTLDRAHWFGAG